MQTSVYGYKQNLHVHAWPPCCFSLAVFHYLLYEGSSKRVLTVLYFVKCRKVCLWTLYPAIYFYISNFMVYYLSTALWIIC
jgi:hypothetical protein